MIEEGSPGSFGCKRRLDLDSEDYDVYERANGDLMYVPPGTSWFRKEPGMLEYPIMRESELSPGLRAAIEAAIRKRN